MIIIIITTIIIIINNNYWLWGHKMPLTEGGEMGFGRPTYRHCHARERLIATEEIRNGMGRCETETKGLVFSNHSDGVGPFFTPPSK